MFIETSLKCENPGTNKVIKIVRSVAEWRKIVKQRGRFAG